MRPSTAALLAAFLAPLPLAAQQVRPPFTEGFDAVVPPALPAGWVSSQVRTPGTNDFTSNASSARSSPNALLSTNATIGQHIATPLLDFGGRLPDSALFHSRRSSTHLARLVVEASTDGGATYPLSVGDTITATGSTGYVRHALALPADLQGRQNVRVRWRVIADAGGPTGTLRLDDVSITARQADDLALETLVLTPARPAEGEPSVAGAVVRNAGLAPATGYEVEFFVDVDGDSIPAAAERAGRIPGTVTLAPGDSARLTLPLPAQPPGMRRIIGLVAYAPDGNTANDRRDAMLQTAVRPGSIAVNEVMYAPGAPEPEWVELVNTRADTVDLRGWSVSDNQSGSPRPISAASLPLAPGALLVLTGDSLGLREARSAIPSRIVAVAGFPALNNTGDGVVLFDPGGSRVDSMGYLPAWGGAGGRSLERIDAFGLPLEASNWGTTVDSTGATAGRANSIARADTDLAVGPVADAAVPPGTAAVVTVAVKNPGRTASRQAVLCLADDRNGDSVATPEETLLSSPVPAGIPPGDSAGVTLEWRSPPAGRHRMIALVEMPGDRRRANDASSFVLTVGAAPGTAVVNEIMYDPLPGGAEYVEVANAGRDTLDLAGWSVRVGTGTSAVNHPLASVRTPVPPGGVFLLASDSSVYAAFSWVGASPHVLAGASSLGLNNDGDAVVLVDAGERTVDSLEYSPGWHNPGVADPSARSLERIRPGLPSADRRSWSTSAAAEGGTPARVNSILAESPTSTASLSFSPNPFSPDADGREDYAVIRYELPVEVSTVTVRIYDVRGRLIRRLAVNEPAGRSGEFVWDGRDDALDRARIGPYVVLVEFTDSGGSVREAARGVLVLGAKM
jgi:hypothetical protein